MSATVTDAASTYRVETVWMPRADSTLTLGPRDLVLGSDQASGGHYVTVLRHMPEASDGT